MIIYDVHRGIEYTVEFWDNAPIRALVFIPKANAEVERRSVMNVRSLNEGLAWCLTEINKYANFKENGPKW